MVSGHYVYLDKFLDCVNKNGTLFINCGRKSDGLMSETCLAKVQLLLRVYNLPLFFSNMPILTITTSLYSKKENHEVVFINSEFSFV